MNPIVTTLTRVTGWLIDRLVGDRITAPAPGDIVLLATADGEAVAGLWRNILEQWGVYCLIKNVSSLAHLRMGDIFEVYVKYEDLAYARELLDLPETPLSR